MDYSNYSNSTQVYRIYRINNAGGASWVCTRKAASASDALLIAHGDQPTLVPEGGTFVVVPNERNPDNAQIVFTLRRQAAPVQAVAVSI